ncbi:TolC family outer membrane protein [Profundibacter sp.]|uniref:TolC family outer membrane protein n=1 Tax=Profundibacter sp. TaxID=3101071 RepID=UPI003D1071EF
MGYRVKPILAAAFAAITLATAPAAKAEGLNDALISAYKNSGLLEQNRALLRAADEDVAQAVSALRPVLSYYANATYADPVFPGKDYLSGNLGLQASLLLYDGGGSQFAIEGKKESVLTAREGLVNVEQSVLLRAVTAYMNVRRDTEFVSLRQNNVRVIREQLRAAKDRFEVGEVTRTDVSLAESRLALARANLAAAQGGLARSREEYRAAVGHYPKGLRPAPKAPATAKSIDAARSVAYVTHPLMRKIQHEVAAAELGVEQANALMKPRVSLTGRVNHDSYGLDSSSIGIELGGPIYQGGKLSSVFRKAVAGRDQVRAGLHLTRLDVAQGVGNAWASLQVARATLAATVRQIKAARVAFKGVKEEATLGARTTLDVLDAEQELLDAEANRISALTDQYIATYSLLSAMGLLTVDHLKLGIRTYDPSAYYNAVANAPADSSRGKRLDRVLRALGKE